jgi:N-hydroxyarylamine O-acetyltransferase
VVYNKTLFDRYLNILGINYHEPSVTALHEIVKTHLTKVPFENISKLIYKKQGLKNIPDLSVYLDGIEKFSFGGTCYSNNYYLYLLLKYLGYDITLCGADMKNPDVHIVSMVKIGKRDFIVDVGYAAPFTEPLPRDLKENYVVTFGDENYILHPRDESGYSKLEHYYKGELKHGYIAKPQPCKIDKFRNAIEDSYRDDATFMNAVMIAKFYENGSIVLRNLTLTKTDGNKVTTRSIRRDEISAVAEKYFRIPGSIVEEAINELLTLKNTWD